MRNYLRVPVCLCVAIALSLMGAGARAEPKTAPIRIGANHNLNCAF
jgi:hypothetical protein